MTGKTHGLISMPEIAELAGVQRPVVTVWRKRHHESFPPPAGGDASRPLFDARAVADWLANRSHIAGKEIQADLQNHTLWHLSAGVGPSDFLAFTTALICLRLLDDDEPLAGGTDLAERAERVDPDNHFIRSEITALTRTLHDNLPAAVDELIEASWGCRPAFERLLAMRNRLGVTPVSRDAVAPELGRLVAGVSGARAVAGWQGAVRVADPWAGCGDLLAVLLADVGEEGAPVVRASARDEYLARLLHRRLAVWDVPEEDRHVMSKDASGVRDGVWDVLIAHLPYRATEQRHPDRDLAVLRDMASKLRKGQCVVALTSADLTADRLDPAATAVRGEFLRTGAVEAVVSLPARLLPARAAYRPALWVLRRDESGRGQGRVLVADVSGRPLTATVVADLVEDVVTWRREGFRPVDHRRAIAHPVAVADLLSGSASLRQPRQLEITEAVTLGPVRVVSIREFEAKLALHGRQRAVSPLRSGVVTRPPGARRTMTVGTLVEDRKIVRVRGNRIEPAHITPAGHHRVIGGDDIVRMSRGTAGADDAAAGWIDRAVLADRYPRAALTMPGDVVVTLTPSPAATVDEPGYSVVQAPATVLRLNPKKPSYTPHVLAALVASAPLFARAGGVGRTAPLDALHLPELDDAEVAALDSMLEQIEERRRRAAEEVDTLDALRRVTLAGLADGTLTISAETE